jgi:hypothetical protein
MEIHPDMEFLKKMEVDWNGQKQYGYWKSSDIPNPILILEGEAWESEMVGRGANFRASGLVISYQDTLNVYTYNAGFGASQGASSKRELRPFDTLFRVHKCYRVSDSIIPELTTILQVFTIDDIQLHGRQGWSSFLSFFDRFLKTSLELLENGERVKEELIEKTQTYEKTIIECHKMKQDHQYVKEVIGELKEYETENAKLMEEIERKHTKYLELLEENKALSKEVRALDKELESRPYTQKAGMRRNKLRNKSRRR